MPNRCFVPNCNTGFPGHQKSGEKIALFAPPKDEAEFKQWDQAIPRKDTQLKPSSRICSLHFQEDDVIKGRVLKTKDGKEIFYPWNNWSLKEKAIPRLFPGLFNNLIPAQEILTVPLPSLQHVLPTSASQSQQRGKLLRQDNKLTPSVKGRVRTLNSMRLSMMLMTFHQTGSLSLS